MALVLEQCLPVYALESPSLCLQQHTAHHFSLLHKVKVGVVETRTHGKSPRTLRTGRRWLFVCVVVCVCEKTPGG